MDKQLLTGKVALVTGGSRGIGFAVAEALLADGTSVAITGRDGVKLNAAKRQLEARWPGRVEAYPTDVRHFAEVSRATAAAVDRFGGLDILVNNAGVGLFNRVADMTSGQWTDVIETNLTGVFFSCSAAIPFLKARGRGWIVNISSLAATNAFVGGAAYCASKAGLNAFSEALMQELRYEDIRVTYVMPGSVATGFGGDPAKGADWKTSADDVAQVVLNVLQTHPRCIPSRVELRPAKPAK